MNNFIISTAKLAGKSLKNNFGVVTTGKNKSRKGDIVTKADFAAEKIILQAIRNKYPTHNILSEEDGRTDNGSDYTWVVDPLDGTKNFATGIPLFATTIAKVYKGEVIEGVCFDPLHNELFYAKKGRGAYLNGKKIKTNSDKKIDSIGLGVGNVRQRTDNKKYSELRSKLNDHSAYWRVFGTAVLDFCYVANGRISTFVLGGVYPWDVAAAGLIVQEAGGVVTGIDGSKWQPLKMNQEIIASSTKELNNKILKIIINL